MTVLDTPRANASPAFVDNDPGFVAAINAWLTDVSMPERATLDPEECLRWIEQGLVNVVIADLKMPGVDGVTFLERVHQINSGVTLLLLSGYAPEGEERARLDRIGAQFLSKLEDMSRLAEFLRAPNPTANSGDLLTLRTRLGILEELHQEWVSDLKEHLGEMPNPESAWIAGGEKNFNVAQLIADLNSLSPRGIEHIRLWKNAMRSLRSMGRRV